MTLSNSAYPVSAVYQSVLSTSQCSLPVSAVYLSVLSISQCCLPVSVVYQSVLSTSQCCLQRHGQLHGLTSRIKILSETKQHLAQIACQACNQISQSNIKLIIGRYKFLLGLEEELVYLPTHSRDLINSSQQSIQLIYVYQFIQFVTSQFYSLIYKFRINHYNRHLLSLFK